MRRYLPVVCLCMVLTACVDKVICPAFQSTYILDDSTRYAYYSYVWQLDETTRTQFLAQSDSLFTDSLSLNTSPKTDYYAYAGERVVPWRVRGRTKYGIVKYEPYWLKKYRMRTAPMENVFAPEPIESDYVAGTTEPAIDSTLIASIDSLGNPLDSLGQPLVAMQPVEEEDEDEIAYLFKYDPADDFNVEQEYYNKHFGQSLIDNRPKQEPLAPALPDSLSILDSDSTQKKKVSFKGLFKKKKNQSDSTTTTTSDTEEPPVEDSNDG